MGGLLSYGKGGTYGGGMGNTQPKKENTTNRTMVSERSER